MAWRSTGKTNVQLITNLKRNGIFHSDGVMAVSYLSSSFKPGTIETHRFASQAMSGVDRAHYVLDKLDAYEDAPQLRI